MNSDTIRKLTVALRARYPFFSFISVTPAGVVLMPSKQPDGTISFDVPKLDDFDRRICDWYSLSETEWAGLSDDAQHIMIDRYTQLQNMLIDRRVERSIFARNNPADATGAQNTHAALSKRMQQIVNDPELACQLKAHDAAHTMLQQRQALQRKALQQRRAKRKVKFEGAYLDPDAMLAEHVHTYGLQAQRYTLSGRRRAKDAPDYLPI